MKRIYYSINFHYENILSQVDPVINNRGFYWVQDILGREHYIPISLAIMIIEPWNGAKNEIDRRFWPAIEEMQGKETGILSKELSKTILTEKKK